MSFASASRSLAASLLFLLASAAAAMATAQAAPAAGTACHNDIVSLRSTCYQYVQDHGGPMVQPSPHCCATVRGIANATCVCDYFSSLDNLNLDRVFYVAGQCGVAIPWSCGGEWPELDW